MAKESPTHLLARLFPNRTVLDVLALLVLHPGERLYQREIADRTGATVLQVQRALKRIVDAGLAEATREGNRVYYAARRDHPAYEDLKRVLIKTVALGDQLREALAPHADRLRLAFVYGSFAAGTESARSDIDLLLVGDLTPRQAAGIFGPLGRELDREFNPVVYPPAEFREKARADNRFIRELIAGPKIWLVGDDDELESVCHG